MLYRFIVDNGFGVSLNVLVTLVGVGLAAAACVTTGKHPPSLCDCCHMLSAVLREYCVNCNERQLRFSNPALDN